MNKSRVFLYLGTVLLILIVLSLPMLRSLANLYWDGVLEANANAHLLQIACALQLYHDAHGSFPPEYTVDSEGRRLHSWRVLLLPYIGEQELYNKFDLSKPWDAPENLALVSPTPELFRSPWKRNDKTVSTTPIVAAIGPGTAWNGAIPVNRKDIKCWVGGPIMIVYHPLQEVCWTEPRDFSAGQLTEAILQSKESAPIPVMSLQGSVHGYCPNMTDEHIGGRHDEKPRDRESIFARFQVEGWRHFWGEEATEEEEEEAPAK